MKLSIKYLYPLIYCLCFSSPEKVIAQDETVDHWETVIYNDDIWKYNIGSEEPVSFWMNIFYDDTAWSEGPGGIGYGDGDDNTIIDTALTLYLRIKFDIVDLQEIIGSVLHVDYDDAFIAYLNDAEIARANIIGEFPAHDKRADYSGEALLPQGEDPPHFIFDPAEFIEGENILAIQVHNISILSNDLSSTLFLSVGVKSDSLTYRSTPDWFDDSFLLYSSDLPIVVIDTRGREIPDNPKIMARMGIISNTAGDRNNIGDDFSGYDGHIGIELRGQITQTFPKLPYSIETRFETGDNRNVPILGFPEENDWVLNAAYLDKTLMRHPIAHYMARRMGRWSSRTTYVELVLNGEYEGIYVFMESIKRDANRVDIAKLTRDDLSGDELTGGYIYEVSQQKDEFGKNRSFVYPSAKDILAPQRIYIKNYDDDFRELMESPGYADPDTGYSAWIDVDAFIDEILVQEALKNSSAYGWSSYFHKDKLGKLRAGPIWDFDQALSNSIINCGDCFFGWNIERGLPEYPAFWKKLFNEPKFKEQLSNRWFHLRAGPFHTDSLLSYIDESVITLSEAQERNFSRWQILGVELWSSTDGWWSRDSYQEEVDYMKDYLVRRLEWMDNQLQPVSVEGEDAGLPTKYTLLQNYPNPFNPSTTIEYALPRSGEVSLIIYNLLGEEMTRLVIGQQDAGYHNVSWNASHVSSGIYFYRLRSGDFVETRKMMLLK